MKQPLLTIYDFWLEIIRYRKRLLSFAFLCALLAASYSLMRPVVYEAEGLFREKQNRSGSNGMGSSLTDLLVQVGPGGGNEAVSLMKSRAVMQNVAADLALQATIHEKGNAPSRMGTVVKNMRVQLAYWIRQKHPVYSLDPLDVQCTTAAYDAVAPRTVVVHFIDDSRFKVQTSSGVLIGKGKCGVKFRGDDFALTLRKRGGTSLTNRQFIINLLPLEEVVNGLSKGVEIEPDKDVKTLLTVTYRHPRYDVAKAVVNAVMQSYEDFIESDVQRISKKQLDYLEERKNDSYEEQELTLKEHAKNLSKDISLSGFTDTEVEMRFLMENQLEGIKDLDKIDMQMHRLQAIIDKQEYSSVPYWDHLDSHLSRQWSVLRELIHQRDSLHFALRREREVPKEEIENLALDNLADLENVTTTLQELRQVAAAVESGSKVNRELSIYRNPSLLVAFWEKRKEKEAFLSYLKHTIGTYDVYSQILHEKTVRQHSSQSEFQGVDLEAAKKLVLAYTTQCHDLEAEVNQNQYIVDQFEKDDFEVASLSTSCQDPVCRDLIHKSSQLSLQLRDDSNRSSREHDRIRSELETHKKYLRAHLQQSSEILSLKRDLWKEKIYSLQQLILDLIQEKIAILEQGVREYLQDELKRLGSEKRIRQQFLSRVNQKMRLLPEKWVSEQLFKQKTAMSTTTVEQLTQMVEGKNISQHLEVVQSSLVDEGVASKHPRNPNIILFSLLGSVLGLFLGFAGVVVNNVVSGTHATLYNLRVSGFNVAGKLSSYLRSPLDDNDLETLRRLDHSLLTKRVILFFENGLRGLSKTYSSLLYEKGESVIVINLSNEKSEKGLFDYLEGKINTPHIEKKETYSEISWGGISRFKNEMLSRKKFSELVETLEYDRILIAHDGSLKESNQISIPCDHSVVVLRNEKLHTIDVDSGRVTFLLT